jgi:hypothetical protein
MTAPTKPICTHKWKWAHDYIGDSGAAYGQKRIDFRVCGVCGVENHMPEACGDCDPCLGGRSDQCALFS